MAQAYAERNEKRFLLDRVSQGVFEDLREAGVAEADAFRKSSGVQQSLNANHKGHKGCARFVAWCSFASFVVKRFFSFSLQNTDTPVFPPAGPASLRECLLVRCAVCP